MNEASTPPELPEENNNYRPVIHKKIEAEGQPTKNVTISVRRASLTENNWAMLAHLSTLLGWILFPLANFIAPLVIWQAKKDSMPFAARHAKEALNFQISIFIYLTVSLILFLVLIGILGLIALPFINVFFTILACIKANEGKEFRYPMTIRFVK